MQKGNSIPPPASCLSGPVGGSLPLFWATHLTLKIRCLQRGHKSNWKVQHGKDRTGTTIKKRPSCCDDAAFTVTVVGFGRFNWEPKKIVRSHWEWWFNCGCIHSGQRKHIMHCCIYAASHLSSVPGWKLPCVAGQIKCVKRHVVFNSMKGRSSR